MEERGRNIAEYHWYITLSNNVIFLIVLDKSGLFEQIWTSGQ